MSKRWMKGLGTGLHELGSTMQARDASAAAMAFKERTAAIAHQRAQDIEALRHKYRTENTKLSDKLAGQRQERGFEHAENMVGVRTEAQKDVAGHTDSLARGRTLWERGLDANRYVDEQIDGGGIIQRDTLSGKASVLQSPDKGEIAYRPDGTAYRLQGNRAQPIMEEAPGGIVPGDLGPPGGEGGSSVGGTATRPFRAAGKGKQWRVGPHPSAPGQLALIGSDGDIKALPKVGPEWKVSVDDIGGVTAVNKATGEVAKYDETTGGWQRMPPPGAAPAAAPGALPENPSDDDLRRYYRAQGVPDEKIEAALASRSPGQPANQGQPARTFPAPESGPQGAIARRPAQDTDKMIRDAYAKSPGLAEQLKARAREVVRSGTDEEVVAFWKEAGESLRVLDKAGLYNRLRNRLQKVDRRLLEEAAPADPRAAAQDEFIERAGERGVPGMMLGRPPQ